VLQRRVGNHHQVEVADGVGGPDDERPALGHGGGDLAGDPEGVERSRGVVVGVELGIEIGVEPRGEIGVGVLPGREPVEVRISGGGVVGHDGDGLEVASHSTLTLGAFPTLDFAHNGGHFGGTGAWAQRLTCSDTQPGANRAGSWKTIGNSYLAR